MKSSSDNNGSRNKKVITSTQMDKLYADSYNPDWKPGGVSDRYRSGYDQIEWKDKRRTKSV